MEAADAFLTLEDVVRSMWEKCTPKYNTPNSWSAVYHISFLCVDKSYAGEAAEGLKLVNAGLLFDETYDRLRCNAPSPLTDRVVWQVSRRFLQLLQEVTGEELVSLMSGVFSHFYWPKVLGCQLEWQPGKRSCWIHWHLYNPSDDNYTLPCSKAMVVGIEPHEQLVWTTARHRHFPLEIRQAIFTLVLIHRHRPASLLARLSRDELLHVASLVPSVWPSPCLAHVRRSGVSCSGGFVRAEPMTQQPPQYEACKHPLLLCKAHFVAGRVMKRSMMEAGGKTWHRCLSDCDPWWVLEWTGLVNHRSAIFWQRHFERGMLVEDGVVVEGSFEDRDVVIVQRPSGAQEERPAIKVVARIVRAEDVGRWCCVYQYLGYKEPQEPSKILFVRESEVGVAMSGEGGGPVPVIGHQRVDCCLCLEPQEAAQLVVSQRIARKKRK